MTHALVFVSVDRDALRTLGGELADVPGVAYVYSVTGEWDFVAVVRVLHHDDLAEVVTSQLARLPGIQRTYTMVAFQAFSRHDLEAMFSIGMERHSGAAASEPESHRMRGRRAER